jgi:cholesterol oxidase
VGTGGEQEEYDGSPHAPSIAYPPPVLTRRGFLKLGAAAGAVLSLPRCGGRTATHTPALVVGSGFGGAIAALRLTQAGVPTTLLERGRRWTPGSFSPGLPPDRRAMWLREYTALPIGPDVRIDPYIGVLERIDANGIQVYAGAGYGGGSLVYGSMSVQPSQTVFEQVFPAAANYAELDATYYPRVRAALSLAVVPEDLYANDIFLAARVFRAQAAAAGLPTFLVESATDWTVIREELDGTRPQSALLGELIYGSNSGYKTSVDRNYLPMAEATGLLTVHTQHKVTAVAADGVRYVVDVAEIDELGVTVGTKTFTCDRLFLAAGSMGTSSLLVEARARGDLPNLNEHVGTGWGTNGNAMFLRTGVGTSTGVIQAMPPITGINWPDSPNGPVLVEHAPYPTGFDCACLLSLGCALTSGRGTFGVGADGVASLTYPQGGNDQAVAAVRHVADVLNETNGGRLATQFHEDTDVTSGFTYHPLGGAVMGMATDLYGRVDGHPGLYVVDSALIPGSAACTNPSLTIAAIAERCLDHIVAEDLV